MSLIDLLPEFYKNSLQVVDLQISLDPSVAAMSASRDNFFAQCYVKTATWGLALWEKAYGIKTDAGKPYSARRETIMAKLRGTGTTTKSMIEDTAAAYSGGEVEIIEHPESYSFTVRFIGTLGIPANLRGLTQTIEEIKPAHLSFNYEYTYHTWAEVSGYLWGDVSGITWAELAII